MKKKELDRILEYHRKWLNGDGGIRADLRESDLSGSDLRDSDLRGSDLSGSDLRGSSLRGSSLRGSDLRDSDLRGSSLRGSDLRDSDLRGSSLRGSDIRDSDLRGARLPHFQICEGELIGWKKISDRIIKIKIPYESRRTASLVGRKCRAEFAEVLDIEDGNLKQIKGGYADIVYKVGETVYADNYDDDVRVECTHGIHFFQTRKEAEEY